jgi:hypothetical protein
VKLLCSRCLMLRNGQLELDGDTDKIVQRYFAQMHSLAELRVADRVDRVGDGSIRVENIWWEQESADISTLSREGGRLNARIELSEPAFDVAISIHDDQGILLTECDTRNISPADDRRKAPSRFLSCSISSLYLSPGRYYMNVAVLRGDQLTDYLQNVAMLEIGETAVNGRFAGMGAKGPLMVPHVWRFG